MQTFGTVGVIESLGDIPRYFQVLNLIGPDGNDIAVVEQDIRRHQDRIGEQSCICGNPFGDLVFVRGAFFEQAELCHRHQ